VRDTLVWQMWCSFRHRCGGDSIHQGIIVGMVQRGFKRDRGNRIVRLFFSVSRYDTPHDTCHNARLYPISWRGCEYEIFAFILILFSCQVPKALAGTRDPLHASFPQVVRLQGELQQRESALGELRRQHESANGIIAQSQNR